MTTNAKHSEKRPSAARAGRHVIVADCTGGPARFSFQRPQWLDNAGREMLVGAETEQPDGRPARLRAVAARAKGSAAHGAVAAWALGRKSAVPQSWEQYAENSSDTAARLPAASRLHAHVCPDRSFHLAGRSGDPVGLISHAEPRSTRGSALLSRYTDCRTRRTDLHNGPRRVAVADGGGEVTHA
jgi:hypothetical protein